MSANKAIADAIGIALAATEMILAGELLLARLKALSKQDVISSEELAELRAQTKEEIKKYVDLVDAEG